LVFLPLVEYLPVIDTAAPSTIVSSSAAAGEPDQIDPTTKPALRLSAKCRNVIIVHASC
jgi:hypothetical protein